MNNDYEQMELDTRSALQAVIEDLTTEAIASAGLLIQEHHRQAAHATMTAPPYVRNRHEAYGVAAEQLVKITSAVKAIKNDTDTLLGTLILLYSTYLGDLDSSGHEPVGNIGQCNGEWEQRLSRSRICP